jgi:hypothetical protein
MNEGDGVTAGAFRARVCLLCVTHDSRARTGAPLALRQAAVADVRDELKSNREIAAQRVRAERRAASARGKLPALCCSRVHAFEHLCVR